MRTDRLVLVVPGLLLPAAVPRSPAAPGGTPLSSPPAAPCLARLLAAAGAPELEPDGVDAALARIYALPRQTDWPLAPLLVSALGVDPGVDYWLVADPVTLVVGRNEVTLASAVTDLAPDDAAMLTATLNAHFAADGLVFVAPRPNRWFARSATVPAIVTRPLAAALGQPLRALLPTGPDAGKWRRWQDEIQMLLHEHPVNEVRERRAQPPVNSLWLWGGGTQPPANTSSIQTCANGGTAAALAAYAGAKARALPANLDCALGDDAVAETTVIALDGLPDVVAVEHAWVAPAWLALTRGIVAAVTLITDGDGAAAVWTARQPSAWQRLSSRFGAPDLEASLARGRSAI